MLTGVTPRDAVIWRRYAGYLVLVLMIANL